MSTTVLPYNLLLQETGNDRAAHPNRDHPGLGLLQEGGQVVGSTGSQHIRTGHLGVGSTGPNPQGPIYLTPTTTWRHDRTRQYHNSSVVSIISSGGQPGQIPEGPRPQSLRGLFSRIFLRIWSWSFLRMGRSNTLRQ